jgi:hypothetical protein
VDHPYRRVFFRLNQDGERYLGLTAANVNFVTVVGEPGAEVVSVGYAGVAQSVALGKLGEMSMEQKSALGLDDYKHSAKRETSTVRG